MVCFIIVLIVLILLYKAAIISCYCLRKDKLPKPAAYNYNRRRSTKYGATGYRYMHAIYSQEYTIFFSIK